MVGLIETILSIETLTYKFSGGVAQLVRALACHARGRGFESRHSRHQHFLFHETYFFTVFKVASSFFYPPKLFPKLILWCHFFVIKMMSNGQL